MNSYANHKRSSIQMSIDRSFFAILSVLSIALMSSLSTYAQVSTAQISGILKDNTGAILPGVKIVAIDKQTGKETLGSTNENGYYVVSNLQPGLYDIRIEVTGFKQYLGENITLSAGDRVNISPAMEVGAVTEVVSVTSAGGDNVETENATVGQLIDGDQVRNLALNGRNAMTLLSILPGVTITNQAVDRGGMAFGSVGDFSVNGMRGNTLQVTVDGGANQDSGNIASLTNNVSVDFIGEVKVATSAYGAEYGRYGGSHINVNIRKGTKNYHGTLWEFFRNDVLNANHFFLNAIPDSSAKETLRFNNFGWNLGGPVYIPGKFNEDKKKLFFFAGQEYKRRIDGDTRLATIPTRAFRNGDFSIYLDPKADYKTYNLPGKTANVKTIQMRYPSNFPIVSLRNKNIPGNILPSKYFTENGRAFMRAYDALESMAVYYVDTPTSNNITFLENNRDIRRQDLIRLDYNLSPKNNFAIRYLYDTGSSSVPYESSSIPLRRATRRNQATNIQFTWNTTINSRSINELSAVSNYLYLERFPYDTELINMDTYGFNIKELFGDEMYTLGMPEFSMLGYTAIPGGRGNPKSPVWDGSIRDNFSTLVGNHQLKLGALFIRNRKNERASGRLPGDFYFSTARNRYTSRNAVLDTLFGNFRDYVEGDNDKFSYIRFSQYDGYIADTWKARPNLTLDFGLRYSYMGAPYEINNTIATFDPSRYDFANAQKVYGLGTNIGQIIPGIGKQYNGIVIGGDGFSNASLAALYPEALNMFSDLPRSVMKSRNKFSPRFGFSWDPFKSGNFVMRGGAGIYYGRINLISVTAGSNPPFSNDVTVYNGNVDELEFKENTLPVSITGIRPNTDFPVTYNWSFGFQKKLPSKTLLDVNYVSTQGRRLLRRPDINKVDPYTYYRANPSGTDLNATRLYQGYGSIYMYESSASSSYHGLQMGLSRRYAKNLSLSVAYTFSKALTDASEHNSGVEDLTNYAKERSHASFDRNHVFSTSYTYNLPFYQDQKGITGKLLGGWSLSGIIQAQTGRWLTVTYGPTIGTRRMDLVNPIEYLDPRTSGNYSWFNTESFAQPPTDRWGTTAPNILKGPGYHNWDMSMFKTFKTSESTKLQFRVEAFNVWNHTNFKNPITHESTGGYGTVIDTEEPRLIQFALKFNF